MTSIQILLEWMVNHYQEYLACKDKSMMLRHLSDRMIKQSPISIQRKMNHLISSYHETILRLSCLPVWNKNAIDSIEGICPYFDILHMAICGRDLIKELKDIRHAADLLLNMRFSTVVEECNNARNWNEDDIDAIVKVAKARFKLQQYRKKGLKEDLYLELDERLVELICSSQVPRII